ncbi:uncharacterized protein Dh44 [Fopius arisanus]|uniref:DIUH_0 protein n=1 Tax=Fopius arisanus TaxID=64838 RepID=A0A0C9PPC4_9HYME|nr:PREDICTED: uncharacterized protein LOC105267007 [Fopius arisanus]
MKKRILTGLFIAAMIMNLTKSTSYRKRATYEILAEMLYIAKTWDSKEYHSDYAANKQTRYPNIDNTDSSNVRRKKISSLSITNPMDVLRQRFILELARRRQMQQQEQAKANREILNDIGKRSAEFDIISPSILMNSEEVECQYTHKVFSDNPDYSYIKSLAGYDAENSRN